MDLGIHLGTPPIFEPVPASPVQYAPAVGVNLFSYGGEFFVFSNGVVFLALAAEGNIRVANLSMAGNTQTSFRIDPIDKAIEQLWFNGIVVVTAAGNHGTDGSAVDMSFAPGNDPFVITVGALDLHNSTSPDRASVAPWSTWGYTHDGFAKPELSAPGRDLVGPIPAGSTLAEERPSQVVHTADGTYMELSGTSLSAPIVSGIAADLLMLRPNLTPDQVKGALMVAAQPVRHAAFHSAGVGEVFAPGALALGSPPNPNRALNAFLDPDGGDGPVFDDAAWLAAAQASPAWDEVSWLDGWQDAAWSLVSWSDVSWSDVSWSDVSWSDVSWSDVSWTDVSWADSSYEDAAEGDAAADASAYELTPAQAAEIMADANAATAASAGKAM